LRASFIVIAERRGSAFGIVLCSNRDSLLYLLIGTQTPNSGLYRSKILAPLRETAMEMDRFIASVVFSLKFEAKVK
jgi:hypothetical protein